MISTPIQIRFADCDMASHVHNAAYLHYFEQARMNFFVSELKDEWDWKRTGFILKKNIVEYHSPTRLEDAIHVETYCSHIGNKSFTLSYSLRDSKGNLKASGESIVVCFDYLSNNTIEIPETLLGILQKHPLQNS